MDVTHPHAVLKAGTDSFTQDAVGNQITRSGASVSYTAFDMPKTFTPAPGQGGVPVTLDYDGDQRRVRKAAGDDVTVYVGDLYERTTNAATGAVEHRYFVHGSERVVAVVTRSAASTSQETTRYLHVDHLGSVETVTDESGNKAAEKRSYDAFGARRNPKWGEDPDAFSSLTTLGFTGHEDDEELGLVNMKGRLYDPKIGRFLTTDPIVARPGLGQSWNPYSYVRNNPLTFTDPSGFEDEPLLPYSPGCTSCVGGTSSDGATTVNWVYVPIGPPPPPPPPPPPNFDGALVGSAPVPGDLSPTGTQVSSAPQALADGSGLAAAGLVSLPLSTPGLPGSPLGAPGTPWSDPLSAPGPFKPGAFGPGSFIEPPPPGSVPLGAPGVPTLPAEAPGLTVGGVLGGFGFILGMGITFSGDANLEVPREYDIVPYKDSAPGFHNHHGVLDIWAHKNIPGYVRRPANSTTIRLTVPHHTATFAVYSQWLKERTDRGTSGAIDWTTVTSREILELSERQLNVAEVPLSVRLEYYRQFTDYIYGLK